MMITCEMLSCLAPLPYCYYYVGTFTEVWGSFHAGTEAKLFWQNEYLDPFDSHLTRLLWYAAKAFRLVAPTSRGVPRSPSVCFVWQSTFFSLRIPESIGKVYPCNIIIDYIDALFPFPQFILPGSDAVQHQLTTPSRRYQAEKRAIFSASPLRPHITSDDNRRSFLSLWFPALCTWAGIITYTGWSFLPPIRQVSSGWGGKMARPREVLWSGDASQSHCPIVGFSFTCKEALFHTLLFYHFVIFT